MPFLNVKGARLYWKRDGRDDAPALVLLNSIGTDMDLWDAALPLLRGQFTLLRIDARGHGASTAEPGDISMATLADDVLAVADAAKEPLRDFLVRHSSAHERAFFLKTAQKTLSPERAAQISERDFVVVVPAFTVSANLRHRPAGNKAGFTWGAGWQYLDGYVANYEDSRRDFLRFPGYGLCHLTAGYQWRWTGRQLQLETALRNAFDRDLLASHVRVGAGREFAVSARLGF